MEYEDKIRMLTTIAHANGMMSALSCMEGATITKRMALTIDDQLDHMDEVLGDLIKEVVNDDEARFGIIPLFGTEEGIPEPDQ